MDMKTSEAPNRADFQLYTKYGDMSGDYGCITSPGEMAGNPSCNDINEHATRRM